LHHKTVILKSYNLQDYLTLSTLFYLSDLCNADLCNSLSVLIIFHKN